jgi:uncharacterized cupredoxin-like copper-binding protein
VGKLLLTCLTVFVLLSACGGDDPPEAAPGGHDGGGHGIDTGGESFAFGEPGDEAEVDRRVNISTLDSLEFDPPSLDVVSGDTVTFVVTNDGKTAHEFVLGDESYQQEHAAQMPDHDVMDMGITGIEIRPGRTKRLTWTFTEAGEVLYGCHEPGHYEGGMVGTIEVRS